MRHELYEYIIVIPVIIEVVKSFIFPWYLTGGNAQFRIPAISLIDKILSIFGKCSKPICSISIIRNQVWLNGFCKQSDVWVVGCK